MFYFKLSSNLASVGVSLGFSVCWFYYSITHPTMFSKTLLEHLSDVKSDNLYFLCDLPWCQWQLFIELVGAGLNSAQAEFWYYFRNAEVLDLNFILGW